MTDPAAFMIGLLAIAFVIWFWIALPAGMAQSRNRSAVFWVLVSLIVSPFVAILLLLMLGDAA